MAQSNTPNKRSMTNFFGLIILDGWGIGDKSQSDAIFNANTPFMDSLLAKYPNATLKTSGEDVGLPDGQMGNSEVGHLNIGAGRIVYQELTRINKAIKDGEFFKNETLVEAMKLAKEKNVTLHLMGLVSNGGVHSSMKHLEALCEMAAKYEIEKIVIHAFTDGRDCDPKSGKKFIEELELNIQHTKAKIGTLIGRYYAMDRDTRWERIKKAYDLMVFGRGEIATSASEAIQKSYDKDIMDEFIEPVIIYENNQPVGIIKEDDVLISFNFRTDRPREIITVLSQKDFLDYEMKKMKLHVYTMSSYDATFQDLSVIFEKDNLTNTLGEVLSKMERTQVRIAETEKYPHVTFFFSGGREKTFEGERRLLAHSPKVATYDLKPEMSAYDVRDMIVNDMISEKPNFFCLNFANPDMVGHTGVYEAIVKAVETVDSCLKDVVEAGQKLGYEFLVIADHGNADYALNPDGSPNTAHSLNPVPVVLVTEDDLHLNDGILADVAPTILHRMNIASPLEMTGKSLVSFGG